MLLRYEEPNEMVRWDQPLFVVPSVVPEMEGGSVASSEPEPIPLDEIWDAATTTSARKAPGVVAPVSFLISSRKAADLTLFLSCLSNGRPLAAI